MPKGSSAIRVGKSEADLETSVIRGSWPGGAKLVPLLPRAGREAGCVTVDRMG